MSADRIHSDALVQRFRELAKIQLERPCAGRTAARHQAIFDAGREDLSLAKLIEAHWDAIAILQEAGREPAPNAVYGVWASESPACPLVLDAGVLNGSKDFCSGAALIDRALVTAGPSLIEIDIHDAGSALTMNEESWRTEAFRMTRTAEIQFTNCSTVAVVADDNWYTQRSGFWPGACGPAAAWAGGAAGLLDTMLQRKRRDAHSTAHVGAVHAQVWAMKALLDAAGNEFDSKECDNAHVQALEVRHVVEHFCTDTLRRFARALGPAPLVKDAEVVRRYAELDLFLRQSHAERDLEKLGHEILSR